MLNMPKYIFWIYSEKWYLEYIYPCQIVIDTHIYNEQNNFSML